MSETQLFPCPFCGNAPSTGSMMDEDIWSHDTVKYTRVYCAECEIGTEFRPPGWEPTPEEAWQARAALAQAGQAALSAPAQQASQEAAPAGEVASDVIAYKFQSPNGAYWYIRADDARTINYWKDKRKLIPLTDKQARITADGAIYEPDATDPVTKAFTALATPATEPAAPKAASEQTAESVGAREKLHAFLDAAAGEGLVLGGVDAADLYVAMFPDEYALATQGTSQPTGSGNAAKEIDRAAGAVDAERRSPKDFAIEHAEYLARCAEQLIDAVNDLALAEQEREEGTANPSDVNAAQDTVRECLCTVRNRIYEFRKRRDRAATSQTGGA